MERSIQDFWAAQARYADYRRFARRQGVRIERVSSADANIVGRISGRMARVVRSVTERRTEPQEGALSGAG
ncbi:MAG: hypothetical protein H6642_11965 [Caldilineaceae bacterium]|nr:hypothetical protein [Caldilineaceae bacterium]MCB9139053.1 hypothetical protein [Caldilineaceae bacterium]